MADVLTAAERAAIAAYDGPVTRLPAYATTIGPYMPVAMVRQVKAEADKAVGRQRGAADARQRKLDEAEARRIAARDAETRELAARMTRREMMAHLGLTLEQVRYRLLAAGVSALPATPSVAARCARPGSGRRVRVAASAEDLQQMVDRGMTVRQIAEVLQVSRSAAYKRLQFSGVTVGGAADKGGIAA